MGVSKSAYQGCRCGELHCCVKADGNQDPAEEPGFVG